MPMRAASTSGRVTSQSTPFEAQFSACGSTGNCCRRRASPLPGLTATKPGSATVAFPGIEAEVLASRRDLLALLRGAPPPHLRAGWRAAALP